VKQDPLAFAFFGAALALLGGLLLYVFVFKSPEPAPAKGSAEVVEGLRRKLADLTREEARSPPPAAVAPKAAAPRPSAPQAAAPRPAASPASPQSAAGPALEAGRSWRYGVVVEPPAWRDITLTYRTQREGNGVGVLTDFVHAGGKSNFHLGTYAPGHPSHANTRFPGFFMHASYIQQPLKEGQRLSWGWAWQPQREGRMKRYEGRVARFEEVRVPAGTFTTAVIVADLHYIEGGQVQASARETLWYAPKLAQVVKVLREGRTPDEGSVRIVAELAELR
jgi:hypothetical protein